MVFLSKSRASQPSIHPLSGALHFPASKMVCIIPCHLCSSPSYSLICSMYSFYLKCQIALMLHFTGSVLRLLILICPSISLVK